MSKYLTTSLVLVGIVAGIGTGYLISPQYKVDTEMARNLKSMDLGKSDKYVDQRFINAMVEHHNGAIEMAKQAETNSKREEIKSLAKDIISAQQKENEQLLQWKKDWYGDSKNITKVTKINLGSYDEKFDLRFINAMISHHEDAIMMAEEIQQKSIRNEILKLADEIITAQSREIKAMKDWRFTWYKISSGEEMNNVNGMLGNVDNELDLRYINQMIAHHRGAMLLAEQVKDKSHRKEIRDLANEILASEPKAIDELYSWKKAWYNDTLKVADPKVVNLGTNDEKLDLRFLNALVDHHNAGIAMTKEVREKSTRNEILNNADTTENFFVKTKAIFVDWRSSWYGIKTETPNPKPTENNNM